MPNSRPSTPPPTPGPPATPPPTPGPTGPVGPSSVGTSETITGPGYVITNTQYADPSGNQFTETVFTTTDASSDVQIFEDLSGSVIAFYDNTSDAETAQILADIKLYGSQIQCSDFHGKGTIDDYSQLFQAASKIANETKQMNLDVDVEGFNEFANAAEELSALFSSFIIKLENVSIINDRAFLLAVSVALKKIWKLSEVFGKFKETILATSTIQLPKSAHETKVVLESVIGNVNCAMKYISHFVDASFSAPPEADLSVQEKGIIESAIKTIDNWNILCEQGVSIAMSNNPDIQYIKTASDQLKTTTVGLKNATNILKGKLAGFSSGP